LIAAGEGLSFDWDVPFYPGTQYQICMFDKFGATGGCQASYTVIPSNNTASCKNVTFPTGPLGVEAVVHDGPMSQYGWVDQCTDIAVTPKNGTAPYTLTVAPALHPPYNITSSTMNAINWTVSLSWASPFYISLADSAGNLWSNGPLHSGGGGSIQCLSGNQTSSDDNGINMGIAIGSGIGGLALGLFIGIVSAYLLLRWRNRRDYARDYANHSTPGSPQVALFDDPHSMTSSFYRPVPSTPMGGVLDSSMGSSNISSNNMLTGHQNLQHQSSGQYQVEPFIMPGEDGRLPSPHSVSDHGNIRSTSMTPDSVAPTTSSVPRQQSQIYVVHHDSGRAPVTVYHGDGTQVVELPPSYPDGVGPRNGYNDARSRSGQSGSDGRSDGGRTETTSDRPAFLQTPKPTQISKPSSSTP